MDLTPRETEAAHEAGEQAFRDCQARLVAEIATAIECWGGVDPKKGKLRKRIAEDIRCKFGPHTQQVNHARPNRPRNRRG